MLLLFLHSILPFNLLLNAMWHNSNDVSQHLHANTVTNENALTPIKCNLIFKITLYIVFICASVARVLRVFHTLFWYTFDHQNKKPRSFCNKSKKLSSEAHAQKIIINFKLTEPSGGHPFNITYLKWLFSMWFHMWRKVPETKFEFIPTLKEHSIFDHSESCRNFYVGKSTLSFKC